VPSLDPSKIAPSSLIAAIAQVGFGANFISEMSTFELPPKLTPTKQAAFVEV
jgi:hypothetical protein